MTTRQDLLFLATVSEQCQRYSDTIHYMNKIIELNVELTPQERNLLSVGYKSQIASKRTSSKVLQRHLQKSTNSSNSLSTITNLRIINETKQRVKDQTITLSLSLIHHIDHYLLKPTSLPSDLLFYLKMKGDYYRYISQTLTHHDKDKELHMKYKELSRESYEEADKKFKQNVRPTNPLRLGLLLNKSVYYYEIEGDVVKACRVAKEAFDEAIGEIEGIEEEHYRDSTVIMQLLRDNLAAWTQEIEEGMEEKGTGEGK